MGKKILIFLIIALTAVPLVVLSETAKKPPSKVSFDFVDADVRNVLKGLADVMGKNIIIGDDVKDLKDKTITMRLDNVSMEEALDIIVKSKDLSKYEEGNIIRVMTAKKFLDEKKRDSDDMAALKRAELDKLKQGENFITKTFFLNYANAKKFVAVIKGDTTATAIPAVTGATAVPGTPAGSATAALAVKKSLLSESGMVTEVEWTNAIIVYDTKEKIENIKKIIEEHDYAPAQVQIHARIIVADTNFSRDLGIKWNLAMQGSSNFLNRYMKLTPSVTALPANSSGGFAFLVGDAAASLFLDGVIQAGETDGLVKTIATPKVVTSDNQKAKISKGDEIPYQTIAMQGATPTIEYKKAELSIEVTPHVTKDGNIKMMIKVTQNKPYNWNTTTIAMSTKEANTDVIIKDGETVVIGGIYETESGDTTTGIPLLMKIPLLGWLFKSQGLTDKKRELLIFVTPIILKNIYKDEG
ncbi:MAG: hypothetical protein C0392_00485 [Syntrophus sp. (in: bacteria)]|nr:hypothetical protein [Syntrophus sp. (in: bacteria)]